MPLVPVQTNKRLPQEIETLYNLITNQDQLIAELEQEITDLEYELQIAHDEMDHGWAESCHDRIRFATLRLTCQLDCQKLVQQRYQSYLHEFIFHNRFNLKSIKPQINQGRRWSNNCTP